MLDYVLRGISLLSIPLALIMIFGLIRSVGKEQPYRRPVYIKGIVMTSIMMVINMIFMFQALFTSCLPVFPLVLFGGLGFGYFWGKSSKLYPKGEKLIIKRSTLYLVFWGLSYAFTHLLTAISPANVAAAGLAAMFFSTGSSIGMNANLVLRQNQKSVTTAKVS